MPTPLTLSMLAGLEIDDSKSGLEMPNRADMARSITVGIAELAPLTPFGIGERVLDPLGSAHQQPLAGLLEEVWKQRTEMREIAAGHSNPKEVKGDVTLITHSMKWQAKPSLEITWTGFTMPPVKRLKLALDVDVTLKLEGVQLAIESAHITGFKAGKLTSKVEVKYKGLQVAPPLENKVKLPGAFIFPAGGIDFSPGPANRLYS